MKLHSKPEYAPFTSTHCSEPMHSTKICLFSGVCPLVKNHWFSSKGEGRRVIKTNPRILKIAGMLLSGGKEYRKMQSSLRKPLL